LKNTEGVSEGKKKEGGGGSEGSEGWRGGDMCAVQGLVDGVEKQQEAA